MADNRQALAEATNQQMVDRLIAEGALWSAATIAAFRATPRHYFLERIFQYQRKHNRWLEILTRDPAPEQLSLIYSDRALITGLSVDKVSPEVPISSSSQPSLMARMLEDLQFKRGQRVLEVGAGTGYNAALMAHLVGPDLVTSIDVDREVLSQAWDHLRTFPERLVRLQHADGRAGHAGPAPYDRIMVTAATPDLEPSWLEQLSAEGLLLAPLILAPGLEYLVRGTVRDGTFHGRLTRAAYFMPLRAEAETGAATSASLPDAAAPRTVAAPWKGWFDRKQPRANWLSFSQALAFHGWLLGLSVYSRPLDKEQYLFGVGDRDTWCCLGNQDWYVSGETGRELGWSLWQAFLEAGGPWPTEYLFQASPRGGQLLAGRWCYLRQGPRCQQRWELPEQRERAG